MKQILIILGLFASVTTFAQSPRIKLNQITKDTVKGSVLISSPTDSGMVYSRDFYISYGVDTVLILYGDTIRSVVAASVLSDGVTITGDGTSGNELKVDTATVISTIQGLVDSLLNYVTLNGTETITGAKTFTSDLNVDAKIALNAGDNNIVIGDGAGANLVSGQALGNILVGTNAGAVIDSGDYNIANGFLALENNTIGFNNIANGREALRQNISGGDNVANGNGALNKNETGSHNIGNGFAALFENISGNGNIANGFQALRNSTGNYNLANGYLALYSLNSGSNNQAYGYQAGRFLSNGSTALTNANGSLFIGSNTKASANGNSNEIVIGTNAIGNGSNSVTIGASTNELVVMKGRMELNNGGNSVFIGDEAGAVDDGSDRRNVGIGHQALYSVTSANSNVAIGYQALYANTTGSSNVAIGSQALRSTNGANNTGIGLGALYNLISGSNNVANGFFSLYSLKNGSNNQAYGEIAGRFLSDGVSVLDTANGSLFLGYATRALANNSSNEIVIGTSAIGNGSNTITIGSSTTQSLHTRNYEFDIDQTVGGATDNYVLTYDSLDGQISLEPIALSGSATLDFGSTSAQSSSDLTITVTGAADGDVVSLGVPNASVNANTNYTAWVSAANTVTVRFNNYSSGAVDPASGTFKVKVFK